MRTLISAILAVAVGAGSLASFAPPTTFLAHVTGHGRAVILIPGLTSPTSVWTRTVEHLRDRATCHVLEIAGFAGTPPVRDPSLARTKEELVKYLRDNRLARPVLIGHSVGGFLAYWVAATMPDEIAGVLSLEGAAFLPALFNPAASVETMRTQADQMRAGIRGATRTGFAKQSDAQLAAQIGNERARVEMAPLAAKSDPATTAEFLYGLFTTDLRDDVAAISAPVLLLVGTAGIAPAARPL